MLNIIFIEFLLAITSVTFYYFINYFFLQTLIKKASNLVLKYYVQKAPSVNDKVNINLYVPTRYS